MGCSGCSVSSWKQTLVLHLGFVFHHWPRWPSTHHFIFILRHLLPLAVTTYTKPFCRFVLLFQSIFLIGQWRPQTSLGFRVHSVFRALHPIQVASYFELQLLIAGTNSTFSPVTGLLCGSSPDASSSPSAACPRGARPASFRCSRICILGCCHSICSSLLGDRSAGKAKTRKIPIRAASSVLQSHSAPRFQRQPLRLGWLSSRRYSTRWNAIFRQGSIRAATEMDVPRPLHIIKRPDSRWSEETSSSRR